MLAKDKDIAALYDLWCEQRDTITGIYRDTPEQRIPLSQNKEFKAIKNAVIQESLNILYDRITFEEAVSEPEIFTPDEQEQEEPSMESSAPEKRWNDPDNPIYQYACAGGMSILTTDTKGDLYRYYGKIAKDCYGYNVAVIDLRNPTKSDGNNLLHLVNKYMDLHKTVPGDVACRNN